MANKRLIILKNKQVGMSLAEVIIAAAITLLIFTVLVVANLNYYKTAVSAEKSVKATFLLEDGLETVNHLSQTDWTNLPNSSSTIIDNLFFRNYLIEPVNRDTGSNIVLAGGMVDPNIKKITVAVSWLETGGTTTKSLAAYLTKP